MRIGLEEALYNLYVGNDGLIGSMQAEDGLVTLLGKKWFSVVCVNGGFAVEIFHDLMSEDDKSVFEKVRQLVSHKGGFDSECSVCKYG